MPTLAEVRTSAKKRGLTGLVLIAFDGESYSVTSYGEDRAKCRALSKLTDGIADDIDAGRWDLSALSEGAER